MEPVIVVNPIKAGSSFLLDVARGAFSNMSSVNKFGLAPSGIQTTATDIWSRADATPTQQVWIAPTQARIHQIVSSSANDDGDPAGTGARTIRIYGLKTWASAETSEDVTLNGLTNVATANSYVIIHRMKVLTAGASGPNVGTITATADTDATVTAVILPSEGQTEMAIYGVPSTKTAYCLQWYVGIDKSSGVVNSADFRLLVNEMPTTNLTAFLRKDDISLQTTGTSYFQKQFFVPNKFTGPCIIKVQATAETADLDGKAGFDLILVDN